MMLTSELDYDYTGQGRAYPKQGTLKDIGAQVGDVVALVKWGGKWDAFNDFARDKRYTVGDDRIDSGSGYIMIHDCGDDKLFRIISRANPTGPVRTVTRTEIVPGVYGIVDLAGVDKDMVQIRLQSTAALKTWFTASDISYAIQTLTQILGAMEDKK